MLSASGGLTVVVLARDGRIRLGVALSACSVPRSSKSPGGEKGGGGKEDGSSKSSRTLDTRPPSGVVFHTLFKTLALSYDGVVVIILTHFMF